MSKHDLSRVALCTCIERKLGLHGESEVQCLAEIKQNRQTQIGVFNVLNNEMNPFRRISMGYSFPLQSRPQQDIVSENNVCTGNCRLNQRSEFALVHVVGYVSTISLTEMCIPYKPAFTIRRIHIYTIWTLWTPQRTTNDWDNLCKFNRKLLTLFI